MDLSGKILIAMPGMGDPRFEHSVIMVCAHSDDGAMGLIVNKPLPNPALPDLLEQLGITVTTEDPDTRSQPIMFGGPVETGRGFVLHSTEWDGGGPVMEVGTDLAVTATRDILEDIAAGRGPEHSILALGYAGWGPGQLEEEILANGWLIADGDAALALSEDHPNKWMNALGAMGIDPRTLSAEAGHA
ncbi:YqgE/AlgH family protein [Rhodobacteraceae bacterium]|nr:YqgE/AlgH family protein [Paracoccaceae bacterium]